MADIIMSKYGSWKSLDNNTDKPNESRWWIDLRSLCRKRANGNWFNANIKWLVGNGSGISFREDMWIGKNPLKGTYPRLLQISYQIGRKVGDMGVWNGKNWEWTLKWRSNWFEWEKPIVEEFLQLI